MSTHSLPLCANTDELDPREFFVPYRQRPELDRWILSKLNNLIAAVRTAMDNYDPTRAVRVIQEFVVEDPSKVHPPGPGAGSGRRNRMPTNRRSTTPPMRCW